MTTKAQHIRDHSYEAYHHSKGRYSTVTARQVYYAIRDHLSTEHDVWLEGPESGSKTGYFKRFKQAILTELFDLDPSLEASILFEDHGEFFEPFLGTELQLGTRKVRDFVNTKYANRISERVYTTYSIPPELEYNKVLFVEKHGFTDAFRESGMLDRLNMGVVSSQGYAPRAAKALIQHFINRGIAVYVLHDCDMFGYNIHERIAEGSETFDYPLEVTDIGLTVDDVKRLKMKPDYAPNKRDFSEMLGQLGAGAKAFFMPLSAKQGGQYGYYRVELNRLTNDELIALVESKIDVEPLIPDDDDLDVYIQTAVKELQDNNDDLNRDALYEAAKNVLNLTSYTVGTSSAKSAISGRLLEMIGNGNHWARALKFAVDDYRKETVKRFSETMERDLRDSLDSK